MGKKFTELNDKHIEFIQQQKIYFVATAAETGNVNLSPKGGDSLRVIDRNTIAWLNLTGSGNESAAHVLKNPRMTIMFCAFEGPPMILRTYGQAQVLHQSDDAWQSYNHLFPASVAARQIYLLNIDLVQTSCGMSVPYFDYQADRDDLANWSIKQGKTGIEKYWHKKNQQSIDGFATEIVERSGIADLVDE
ncbi:pyridoxamine 5'-phosphate oxidase family protein [Catenovulum sediminis]|uniref:pyridoxamine 5'-phosphate oxidase family protein n=1 Tax=Catenovulum sediminis TaxID=1740262 RepID=UPI00117D6684|nr:pyridoxamine 5'-phosphate oxidase family protein [Catenovulum sediminis]